MERFEALYRSVARGPLAMMRDWAELVRRRIRQLASRLSRHWPRSRRPSSAHAEEVHPDHHSTWRTLRPWRDLLGPYRCPWWRASTGRLPPCNHWPNTRWARAACGRRGLRFSRSIAARCEPSGASPALSDARGRASTPSAESVRSSGCSRTTARVPRPGWPGDASPPQARPAHREPVLGALRVGLVARSTATRGLR